VNSHRLQWYCSNCSKFGNDCQGSFGYGEVQNLPFPIGTITGPYHRSARSASALSDYLPQLNISDASHRLRVLLIQQIGYSGNDRMLFFQ